MRHVTEVYCPNLGGWAVVVTVRRRVGWFKPRFPVASCSACGAVVGRSMHESVRVTQR
jgi:hypothetical protein